MDKHEDLITMTPHEYLRLMYYLVSKTIEIDYDKLVEIIQEWYGEELWDYPVEELDYCREQNISVVRVIFENGESRLFEISEEMKNELQII